MVNIQERFVIKSGYDLDQTLRGGHLSSFCGTEVQAYAGATKFQPSILFQPMISHL